jgi:hypothetical protein
MKRMAVMIVNRRKSVDDKVSLEKFVGGERNETVASCSVEKSAMEF